MLISDLPNGLRQLAERRREEQNFNLNFNTPLTALSRAFFWDRTPEEKPFWNSINNGDFSPYYGCRVSNVRMKDTSI